MRISPKTVVNWAEEEAKRRAREAPEPVQWSDLLPVLRRYYGRPEFRDVMPGQVMIRGTVSAVEVQPSVDINNNKIEVVNIVFRESPFVSDLRPDQKPYSEFNACTLSPDILQDVFGADFRTSMIGKSIEVRGEPWGTSCRGLRGGVGITLARQVRPVPTAQFSAGTRVWVPPPVVVPPPRPAPTRAEIDADIVRRASTAASQVEFQAKSRLNAACAEQTDKALIANPGNRDAIVKEYRTCLGAVDARARVEAQKAQTCAEQVIRADPTNPDGTSRDFEGLQRALAACTQAPPATLAPVAARPTPAPAPTTAPAAPTTTESPDAAAARAKAVQDQQERVAQDTLATEQQSAQDARQRAQKSQACILEWLKTHPDGGQSDPVAYQKGFVACLQIGQGQSAK